MKKIKFFLLFCDCKFTDILRNNKIKSVNNLLLKEVPYDNRFQLPSSCSSASRPGWPWTCWSVNRPATGFGILVVLTVWIVLAWTLWASVSGIIILVQVLYGLLLLGPVNRWLGFVLLPVCDLSETFPPAVLSVVLPASFHCPLSLFCQLSPSRL